MEDGEKVEGQGRCGARRRSGGSCLKPSGWGTDHNGYGVCKLHGGSTCAHRRRAQKMIAAEAVVTFGLSREIDPYDALVSEVRRTVGAVDWLREQVRALDPAEVTWSVARSTTSTVYGRRTIRAARVHTWVRLYQQERKHLVEVCQAAIRAGVEERQVTLAERQGALLAGAIRGILADLDLTPAQAARVPDIVPRHLRTVTAA